MRARAEWKRVVRAGRAEECVRGVGESGGEAGEREWVDLLYRLARRTQEREEAAAMGKL